MTRSATLLLLTLLCSGSAQAEFSAAQYCTNVKDVIWAHSVKVMKLTSEEKSKLTRSLAAPIDDTPNQPPTIAALCYAVQQVRQQMADPLRADAVIVEACMDLYRAIISPYGAGASPDLLVLCGGELQK